MRKYYFLVLGLLVFSGVQAQIVNIPDANFKSKLLAASTNNVTAYYIKIDTNNNGEIEVSEALKVTELRLWDANITSLEGISSFSNLTYLNCSRNNLNSLDLTSLINLKGLDCSDNQFTLLNQIKGIENLNEFVCTGNKFTSLDVTGLINLELLYCYANQLTSLDVTGLTKLNTLFCSSNQLTALNVTGMENLSNIDCSDNQLTSLDVSSLLNIRFLRCSQNKITSLDISNKINLEVLYCNDNNLTSLFIKNTKISYDPVGIFDFEFSNNLNLQYICVNEKQLVEVQNKINEYGYTNCHVNTYCSFVPGGEYYTIQGNTKLDSNNNGCDAADIVYPNLKFSISDETSTGNLISDLSGNYSINVQAGIHTISAVIEDPNYFIVSPELVNVSFPAELNAVTQDFCIVPNGVHPDLEITLLPILRARPGFDTSYKIIYKNKGNQTQSGTVNLTFDDAVLDFVTASPVVTTQSTDNLSWNYLDLKPFETREIALTLNVNSPMETPPVNNDDRLSFTASINPIVGDEQPVDNSFALRQVVVGSFDPNDKTCLEGATIPPSAVGKYVHYLIRFENKGTAEAQNVVVKDMIDTEKFDVSSLVVTQGSHPFVTKISETNKVEFIFENINLPFDDATNDGYVAFKIKTNPSLVVGDSFSNTASIYFDYNFPIVTNTATTSVLQSLGTNDFEFDSYFKIYPNPAKNSLNLDVKKQINVSSISIYNTLGQQILVIPNAQYTKQVDVSNLKTGNYFIKLISDKGSSVGKFLKS